MLGLMTYQLADKMLIAEYLRAVEIAGGRSFEITATALDLPFPVWMAIRSAYYEEAVKWKRLQRLAA